MGSLTIVTLFDLTICGLANFFEEPASLDGAALSRMFSIGGILGLPYRPELAAKLPPPIVRAEVAAVDAEDAADEGTFAEPRYEDADDVPTTLR